MKHIILGKVGEAKAQYFAKQQGFEIIEANYKNFAGEIDLIYLDGTTLVFCEVKTRTSEKFGLPREAVTRKKQQKIRLVASFYIKNCTQKYEHYRFDVMEIIDDDVTLIKNAF